MKLIDPIIKLFLPTGIRHGLAAAAGLLAVSPNAGLAEYATATVMLALTWAWSLLENKPADSSTTSMISNVARALGSQFVAFLSGVLLEHGFTGDPDNTFAVALFAANYLRSAAQKKVEGVRVKKP